MNQRFVIPMLVAVAFGAGFGARVWIEKDTALPPPPAAIGGEFSRATPGAGETKDGRKAGNGKAAKDAHPDRAKLIADIQKMRGQIETYQKKLDELDADFDRQLVALLNPEQRERYAARQKRLADRIAERKARDAADTAPLSDEQIFRLQQIPLFNVLWSCSITTRLDRLNKDIKLEEAQQPKVRELLVARRDRFLDLVDSTPAPSITLSQLAAQAQKLGVAPKK